MIFGKKWINYLPPHILPSSKTIIELEEIRKKYKVKNSLFAMLVLNRPFSIERNQLYCLDILRKEFPMESEKELLKRVFISRVISTINFGLDYYSDIDIEDISFSSFNELCDLIIKKEMKKLDDALFFDIVLEIDLLLNSEQKTIREKGDSFLSNLIKEYLKIKNNFNNLDEHTYLMATFLAKNDLFDSIKKDYNFFYYYVFHQTFVFSCLKSENAIKALAINLINKLFESSISIYYSSDYNILMEPVYQMIKKNLFFDIYKDYNPCAYKLISFLDKSLFNPKLKLSNNVFEKVIIEDKLSNHEKSIINSSIENYLLNEKIIDKSTTFINKIDNAEIYEVLNPKPLKIVFLLSFLTFEIYHFFWFFYANKQIKKIKKIKISPLLRLIGLFLPFINILVIYDTFENINKLNKELHQKIYYSSASLTLLYIVFIALRLSISNSQIDFKNTDMPFFTLFLSAIVGLILAYIITIAQRSLNNILNKIQISKNKKYQVNAFEMLAIIIGLIFWILIIFNCIILQK